MAYTTEIYLLTVVEAGGSRTRYYQGWFLLRSLSLAVNSCLLPVSCLYECLCPSLFLHGYQLYQIGLPWWLSGKESACNAGDQGLISGLGRSPGRGQGNPLQYSCLEIPHGQRSLTGYSPWGCKELNTAERPNTAHTIIGLDSINSRKKPLDCLFYESVVVQKLILSCCFFLYLALHY